MFYILLFFTSAISKVLKMSNLKCSPYCGKCNDPKIFYVTTKLFNAKAHFIDSTEDQWEFMYYCKKFNGFVYPNLKKPLDEKPKNKLLKAIKIEFFRFCFYIFLLIVTC